MRGKAGARLRAYMLTGAAAVVAVAVTVGIAVVAILAAPSAGSAQYVEVPPSPAYALAGVTVVHADGRRQEGVTVVVRGRFIETLASGAAVPTDAEVLEGDSLMVYPGLIDGDGRADHEFPEFEVVRRELEIWNAPRELQGFMPSRRLVGHLTAKGDGVSAQRKAGIVAAAVHPRGFMMSGRGALLLYRADATRPEQLVVDPVLGPRFEFRGGQGVYPATLFGVLAHMRQSFDDARHRATVAAAYSRDPRGLTLPAHDADYAVLQEIMAGAVPVYFHADDAADILRALSLAEEYGFRPIILGGAEAWRVADTLRRRNVPVLVSMEFQSPRRYDPAEDTVRTEPLDAAAQRERAGLEARYANAGRLAAAGVTVALTSGGSGKVLEGARKAVAHGLSETAALAALTRTPAELFGVPSLVRLEPGLPATFIVTTGPLFDEDTRVAYTFVEGRLEEGARPGTQAAAGDPATAASVAGEWVMRLDAQGQILSATMTLEQDGATFTGTFTMEETEARIVDGVINGNEMECTALLQQGGQTLDVKITGTIDGDSASGEADAGPMGVARWTAQRRGPGGAR